MIPVVSNRMRSLVVVSTLVLGLAFMGACRPKHPFVWANELPPAKVEVVDEALRPGDQILVQVPRMDELSSSDPITVNADGSILLPLAGVIRVEGLTVAQVAEQVNGRLKGIIVKPEARVSVVNPRLPVVTVVGEVRAPGRFEVQHGEGVLPALALAGGLTEFARLDEIYVVRKYPTQQRVRFRYTDLVGGVERSLSFVLRDGDVVVVE
jgi:polysaccharide biosynthesis/export protein